MKSSIWIGKKINGELRLNEQELFNSFKQSIPEGYEFQIKLEDVPKPKSKKQLGAHWGLLMETLVRDCECLGIDSSYIFNLPNPTGTSLTKRQLNEFFYALFPTTDENGKIITMSSPKWTTKHQYVFFDSVRNYVASQWGIVVPDPNPNYKCEIIKNDYRR